ncbi:uncharacterized protein LOC110105688, partial [Dendrobium catenatum]|uniref:uncharacterized protein LOC110105688 n=1 Tax=Dendrobium catenatum TaxID=906689 RepID=UPI0009F17104
MSAPTSSSPADAPALTGKTRSFKDVVSGGSSSSLPKVKFVHSTFKGCPALLFEDVVVNQLAAPFSFTLVGKFMLRRPNLDVIRKFFFSLKLSGSFTVGLLDPKHVVVQLSNDLDYSRIFSRRSYYIQGCQMRLLKWSMDFDVREESPIAPVWLAFPNLRLHFFNSHILFGLASVFGRPLQTDQATASLSRPSVARILVELDVTKKHPKEIWLGSENNGYFQKVEIENLPIFCSHCRMHGHGINECFRLHPNLRKEKVVPNVKAGKENEVTNVHQVNEGPILVHGDESGNTKGDTSADPINTKPVINNQEPVHSNIEGINEQASLGPVNVADDSALDHHKWDNADIVK